MNHNRRELQRRAHQHQLQRITTVVVGWQRPGHDYLLVFRMLSGRWAWRPEPPNGTPFPQAPDPFIVGSEDEALGAALAWLDKEAGQS